MDNKYKSIELFAGAGGLALGLEQAGFNHIGLVENDKDAVSTLRLNRPVWSIISEDINTFSEKDLEKEFGIRKDELDLLSGGAPCQSFSNCSYCVTQDGANKNKIWKITEMDADHVTAWSNGGSTTSGNCEMLCKTHNRSKGNR